MIPLLKAKDLSEFPAFAKTPTQEAAHGIRYDFNFGARVLIPKTLANVNVTIMDGETYTIHVNEDIGEHEEDLIVQTKIKYAVKWEITVYSLETRQILFNHTFCPYLKNRRVCVQLPIGALGDTLSWFKWVQIYSLDFEDTIDVVINPTCLRLFQNENKRQEHIEFISKDEASARSKDYYATYRIAMYYGKDKQTDDVYNQPIDYRICGLSNIAANILGMSYETQLDYFLSHPDVVVDDDTPKPTKPYVCIATKTTCYVKHWLNPFGWIQIVDFLKSMGYDVYCIDRDPIAYGHEKDNAARFASFTNPYNAIAENGNIPLEERWKKINNADFFIGLSSGLSWLAWTTKTPIIMISNFTAEHNEFFTPYRVMNKGVCNSCWNDGREKFINSDFFYCPKHRNDSHAYECMRCITVEQVKNTIQRLMSDYDLLPPNERNAK